MQSASIADEAARIFEEIYGSKPDTPLTVANIPIAPKIIDTLYPAPDPFTDDPVGWVENKLRGFLWSKQKEILEAVKTHRRVAVKSCHGPGKSFTASCASAWYLDTHPLGSAFCVTTAPSWNQVEAILWREIRRRYREGTLPGRITMDCKWHMSETGKAHGEDEELIAMGRKPADYDEQTFQGIHARYFMAILDEASGIPKWLWDAVLSLATNENARILAIGNPDDPNSYFAELCKPGSGWHVITISAFDTPNFTGEYVPEHVADSLVSPMWVEDRRHDWGEGSPLWIAKVLGEFPEISDEYLISPALVKRCHDVELPGLEAGRYGVDIARMGVDRSVMYRNRGGQIRLVKWWAKKDTHESTLEVKAELSKHGAMQVPTTIDIIGYGAAIYDSLRADRSLGTRFQVAGHQGSERATNPKLFKNRRSESWWNFREMMEEGLIDLDPEDEALASHLQSVKWGTDIAGRIYIETKDDLRKRGMPSPDHADSAILSTVHRGSSVEEQRDFSSKDELVGDLLEKVM
jgi:hypothetical protein